MLRFITIVVFMEVCSGLWAQPETILSIRDRAENSKDFKMDSAFVVNLEPYDTLEYTAIHLLFQNEIKDSSEYSSSWMLQSVIQLDSLKANGGYADYLANIDIGMIARSQIYLVGEIKINKSFDGIIWGVTYSTFEACPYGYGSFLFLSVVDADNMVRRCIKVAEYSGGGDPPVYGWTKRESIWDKDKKSIITNTIDLQGEMTDEEDIIEKSEKELMYAVLPE